MGILAKKRVLFVLIWLVSANLFVSCAQAGVYALSRVNYFDQYAAPQKKHDPKPETIFSADELWAVQMTDGSGRSFLQRPPEAVMSLLNDPSSMTGLKYLAWNEARIKQLEQASLVLQELSKMPSNKAPR
jgi:hypothetical protein